MTITFTEASAIINAVENTLTSRVSPIRIKFEVERKRIDYAVKLEDILLKVLPMSITAKVRRALMTNATKAAEKARQKAIRSNELRQYAPLQIDAALKVGIAFMYLHFAKNSLTEKEFIEYVNASNPMLLSMNGWFEMKDRATTELYSEWKNIETPNSFAEFCKAVGAEEPTYWRKIYDRIGLDYNSTSPKENLIPSPLRRSW